MSKSILAGMLIALVSLAGWSQTGRPLSAQPELQGRSSQKLAAIEFEGLEQVQPKQLLALLSSKLGMPADPAKVREDCETIDNYLEVKLDLASPVVSHVLATRVEGTRLIFKLCESIRLKDVDCGGLELIDPTELKPLLQSKSGQILHRLALAHDYKLVNEIYFASDLVAHVLCRLSPQQALVFAAHPYSIGAIQFRGMTHLKVDNLLALCRSRAGDHYLVTRALHDEDRLKEVFGLEDCTCEFVPSSSDSRGDLIFTVQEK